MRDTKLVLEPFHLPSGARRFRIYANINGKLYRERFADHRKALSRFKELEAWKKNFEAYPPLQPTPLGRTQLADAELALEQLQKNFPGRTLTWAVSMLHDLEPEKPPISLEEAGDRFLETKLSTVNSKSGRDYRRAIERLRMAARHAKLHEVTVSHIERYFTRLEEEFQQRLTRPTKRNPKPKKPKRGRIELTEQIGPSNATLNHHLARLNTFFLWCAKALPDRRQPKTNPCDGVEKRSETEMSREILTPDQASQFMRLAESFERGALVNYFAFALFAGLRPDVDGELGKLARTGQGIFELLDLNQKLIRLPAAMAKTRRSREIDIQPGLIAFLEKYPLRRYPLQPRRRASEKRRSPKQVLCNALQRFRRFYREKLPHDVLRHSFVSYHLRLSGEYAETARQAGNTEDIIRRHYQRRVTKEDAAAFWSIRPSIS